MDEPTYYRHDERNPNRIRIKVTDRVMQEAMNGIADAERRETFEMALARLRGGAR